MKLAFLVPPMATLFMAAPAPANAANGFAIAPKAVGGRLFPGTVELFRNKSAATRKILVSVAVTAGAVRLLHNGGTIGRARKGGPSTMLLTVGPDDTVTLVMDLAQGAARGSYAIDLV
jgi:hypothetical protein